MSEHMQTVHHSDEIPDFASEAEEAAFWDTHELGDAMFETAQQSPETQALLAALPTRPRKSRPTSLRLGTDLERRLRHLAELKGVPYQTLLKEFVLERVYEEEKRMKVI
ncbi:CopG family antitoxin [Deinococcus sp. MIMF12]|uniref:CopG family antitoxin n=1 Tax=Deinococcus rhizophilus TaxID=3049544 RepID=A0ABT7JC94_9DEIO|nr:CopG family antitoxin [Deinococcus rhizophilus]MDL2342659.1 CopG family antitoxin [Deinococcus rhizophilus]